MAVTVVADIKVTEGKEDTFIAGFNDMANHVRSTSLDCLRYELLKNNINGDYLHVSRWASQSAYEMHKKEIKEIEMQRRKEHGKLMKAESEEGILTDDNVDAAGISVAGFAAR